MNTDRLGALAKGCLQPLLSIVFVLGFQSVRGAEDGVPHQPYIENEAPALGGSGRVSPPADSGQLIEVNLEIPVYPYEVLVDPESLLIRVDGEVRYIVELRTATGDRNRFYEGLRCTERDVRTYAYATADSGWIDYPDKRWSPVSDGGPNRYRYYFYRGILCNGASGAWRRPDILRYLKYGAEMPTDG